MSILSSTKSGLKYQRWREKLDVFAREHITISRIEHKSYRLLVPYYIPRTIGDTDNVMYFRHDFTFYNKWSVEEFKERFIDEATPKLKQPFELEDIEFLPKIVETPALSRTDLAYYQNKINVTK